MRSWLLEYLTNQVELKKKIGKPTNIANQIVSIRWDTSLETHTFVTHFKTLNLKLIFNVIYGFSYSFSTLGTPEFNESLSLVMLSIGPCMACFHLHV